MAKLAVVGDTHGHIDLMLLKVIESEADLIIQVGDFGTFVNEEKMDKATRKYDGLGDFVEYYYGKKTFLLPTYFIKGNHEDFDVIEEIKQGKVPDLYYLQNGLVYVFGSSRIGVFGGNYSRKRFDLDRNHPNLQQERRRHFNHQDVEDLVKSRPIDIIVGHDCPLGVGITARDGADCGCAEINRLIEVVKPKLYVHGHYHRYNEAQLGSTQVIGLDQMTGRYPSVLLLDV